MASTPDLLSLDQIGMFFPGSEGRNRVLHDINLNIQNGERLALVGPSGCGKTTLVQIMSGLLNPTTGRIRFQGKPLTPGNRSIALVMQNYGLLPWKTVSENILLGARLQKVAIQPDAVQQLKAELGIESLDGLYPDQLSGGQQQRAALARALLLKPSLLLLDEPFAALDAFTRERLQELLLTLHQQKGFSLVIVTHDVLEATLLGQRLLVLEGRGSGISALLPNPRSGSNDYRTQEEYFRISITLRKKIEEAA